MRTGHDGRHAGQLQAHDPPVAVDPAAVDLGHAVKVGDARVGKDAREDGAAVSERRRGQLRPRRRARLLDI